MKQLHLLVAYAKYLLTAKDKYEIHSPFVYEFISEILEDKRSYYAFKEIEALRNYLHKRTQKIEVEDFGAGSNKLKSKGRRISQIATTNLISPKFGTLLFKIVQYYKPQQIVELGTSLGISTLYLAQANLKSTVYTFEGSTSIAEIAQSNFEQLKAKNIKLFVGEFSESLKNKLSEIHQIDLIFIDGNHRKIPTIEYFHYFLLKSTDQTIFIFDDIHWSIEMEDAWKYIQGHEATTLTLDLFYKGIVFVRKDFIQKQHFVLKF